MKRRRLELVWCLVRMAFGCVSGEDLKEDVERLVNKVDATGTGTGSPERLSLSLYYIYISLALKTFSFNGFLFQRLKVKTGTRSLKEL